MIEIIRNLPYKDYAARIDFINNSLLRVVKAKSLRHVKAMIDGRIEQESDALDLGKAFHSLLLENKHEYIIRPGTYPAPKNHEQVKKGTIKVGDPIEWNGRAGYCKKWEAEQLFTVLSQDEVDGLVGMTAAVRAEKLVVPYLRGQTELAMFVEKDGRKLKCRVDLLPDDPDGPVIDFKKTRHADPVKFVRSVFDYGYFQQAALTLDILKLAGIPRKEFWFVAVQDTVPFDIFVCRMVDEPISFISLGRKDYREAYVKLMKAVQSNEWPSYGVSTAEEHISTWMMSAIESTA